MLSTLPAPIESLYTTIAPQIRYTGGGILNSEFVVSMISDEELLPSKEFLTVVDATFSGVAPSEHIDQLDYFSKAADDAEEREGAALTELETFLGNPASSVNILVQYMPKSGSLNCI